MKEAIDDLKVGVPVEEARVQRAYTGDLIRIDHPDDVKELEAIARHLALAT